MHLWIKQLFIPILYLLTIALLTWLIVIQIIDFNSKKALINRKVDP